MLIGYYNPYSSATFLDFFTTLLKRVGSWITGHALEMASDEIQLAVLTLVAISCALVGTFLVLRKMTMLANALSHTILLGIVAAYIILMNFVAVENPEEAFNVPFLIIAALCTGLLTTFLTEFLSKVIKLQEDASIGLVFTTLFALGVILVTLFTRNVHIGTEIVMGNVDALKKSDIQIAVSVLLINMIFFTLFFKEFKISTFDSNLSKALGISPIFFNYLLMVLASLTTVGAFRAVGVLMVLALITGPVLTARLFTHRLGTLLALSSLVGFLASLFGVALSRHFLTVYHLPLSTGGVVVTVIVFFYLLAIVFSPYKGLIKRSFYYRKFQLMHKK